MPKRALKVCSCIGCDAHPGSCAELVQCGRCPDCLRVADKRRGTAAQRGYTSAGHHRFRSVVLSRDSTCVRCRSAPSTVADHYPLSRRDLVLRGLDPDDPKYGRGLCASCHGGETARHQPGGWNVR